MAFSNRAAQQPEWSEAIALGSEQFVNDIQSRLAINFRYRSVSGDGENAVLREDAGEYRAGKPVPIS